MTRSTIPQVHDKLVKSGATPVGGTPEALGDLHEGRIREMGPRGAEAPNGTIKVGVQFRPSIPASRGPE